jgi:hypothetical protein
MNQPYLNSLHELLSNRDIEIKALQDKIEEINRAKDEAKQVFCDSQARFKMDEIVGYHVFKNLGRSMSPSWEVKKIKAKITKVNVMTIEIGGVIKARIYYNVNAVKKDGSVSEKCLERGISEEQLIDFQS